MSLEEYKSKMPNLEEQQKQREALDKINTTQKAALTDQEKQTEVFSSMDKSLKEIAKLMGGTDGTYDAMILANLDGTKAKYEAMQRAWFKANGAENADPVKLTRLVSKWYKLTRQLVKDFDGYVEFYNPNTSSLSTGTRKGDIENMECVPSTDKEAGKDDFAGHPLFAVTTCNWVMNGTAPLITAIKGISPDFEQSNPDKYVGVLQMSGYHWWTERSESDTVEKEGYRATYSAAYRHIEPLPEAVKMDGTVREWVLHGKYMAGKRSDGSLSCCSGQAPAINISHNNLRDCAYQNGANLGAAYSGGTSADRSFVILMAKLLFASKTLDGILNGCFNFSVDSPAQVAETRVKRVILKKGEGARFLVGCTVMVGKWYSQYNYYERSLDATNGKPLLRVTAIEEETINDTVYDVVYTDAAEPFDTVVNGDKVAGTTYLATMEWYSGVNDKLLGNNGALNAIDGKHTISIQGIEMCNGSYEVLADTIMKLWKDDTAYYYTPYIVKEVEKQSTDITSDYIDTGINTEQPEADSWQYIKHQSYKNGFYFADEAGGSSSTYEKDGIWMSAKTANTVREFLAFGSLGCGVPSGGLSCFRGHSGVGNSSWSFGARLSPNGNRGNWQA